MKQKLQILQNMMKLCRDTLLPNGGDNHRKINKDAHRRSPLKISERFNLPIKIIRAWKHILHRFLVLHLQIPLLLGPKSLLVARASVHRVFLQLTTHIRHRDWRQHQLVGRCFGGLSRVRAVLGLFYETTNGVFIVL